MHKQNNSTMLLFFVLLLSACAQLPEQRESSPSLYLKDTAATTELGRSIAPLQLKYKNQSGIYPLTEGLDDINSASIEKQMQIVDRHPQIEVRLFNPFAARNIRAIDFLTRFSEVNRRMHNKSLSADSQACIIGGRNIGDEYFQARADLKFGDLDVIAIGSIVNEVADAFDLYYNSETVIPISAFDNNNASDVDLDLLRESIESFYMRMQSSAYLARLRKTEIAKQLVDGDLAYSWGQAHIIYDHPDKALGKSIEETKYLLPQLAPIIEDLEKDLILISPYFIPGDEGVEFLSALVKRGIRVRILLIHWRLMM